MSKKICHECKAEVPSEYLFCIQCGASLKATEAAKAAEQPPEEPEEKPVESPEEPVKKTRKGIEAELREVRKEEKEDLVPFEWTDQRYKIIHVSRGGGGIREYPITGSEVRIGRKDGEILFSDDKFISPLHAVMYFKNNRLYIRDVSGENGIYLKVKNEIPMDDGDQFICGEQILRFSLKSESYVEKGETPFLGSIVPDYPFVLKQILSGGYEGEVFPAFKLPVTIGREGCIINFPDDRFISKQHASLEKREGKFYCVDNRSKNGTYIKIREDIPLSKADILFIGKQLLKIDSA